MPSKILSNNAIPFIDICTDGEIDITYAGLDFFNDTTPDFSRVGEYSDIVFTEEAVRIIDKKVN